MERELPGLGGIGQSSAAEFVPVPGDTHVTNLCFGGPELRKAYVTLSYAGRLHAGVYADAVLEG